MVKWIFCGFWEGSWLIHRSMENGNCSDCRYTSSLLGERRIMKIEREREQVSSLAPMEEQKRFLT